LPAIVPEAGFVAAFADTFGVSAAAAFAGAAAVLLEDFAAGFAGDFGMAAI
jgi:hypothetical protein